MAAPTWVQGKSFAWGTGNGTTGALPANTTAGNLLFVFMEHSYFGCPPTVSDSQGNTWTKQFGIASPRGASYRYYLFTAVTSTSAADTVTLVMGCGQVTGCFFGEISGQKATGYYDVTAGPNAQNNPSNPCVTGAITTSANEALVLSMFVSPISPTFTAISGTSRLTNASAVLMTQVQVAAGSVNPSVTASSIYGSPQGFVVAILPVPAAGGGATWTGVSTVQGISTYLG